MKIDAISKDTPNGAWELYENYRRSLAQEQQGGADRALAAEGTQESAGTKRVADTGECHTCENRKYQDGSDDAGVSFKTPTKISADQAASAVRGHEMEHVNREQGKAAREDRKVVSQSVTYHTAICPECGDAYVSGGTTRTVTKADNTQSPAEQSAQQGASAQKGIDRYA